MPSADDAYDDFDSEAGIDVREKEGSGDGESDIMKTPKARPPMELPPLGPGPPPNTPVASFPIRQWEKTDTNTSEDGDEDSSQDVTKTPTKTKGDGVSNLSSGNEDKTLRPPSIVMTSTDDTTSTISDATPTPTPSTLSLSITEDKDPRELLESLRQTFQRTEHAIYAQLVRTSDHMLNDVRRTFISTAKGALKRLGAWQKKHLHLHSKGKVVIGEEVLKELGVKDVKELVDVLPKCEEPEWWSSGCHAVPGSSVIVREDDWGSIIAFTLRCVSFALLFRRIIVYTDLGFLVLRIIIVNWRV